MILVSHEWGGFFLPEFPLAPVKKKDYCADMAHVKKKAVAPIILMGHFIAGKGAISENTYSLRPQWIEYASLVGYVGLHVTRV